MIIHVCIYIYYRYMYIYIIQYSIMYLHLQVTCDQTSNLETQENLKAPSSCCCTGCANKPGSCIRGWYLSRQLSKETYRLWKLPRVDSQKLRSKKQKLLVQLLQKRWLLHLRLRGSSPGPSFPKRKSVDFQEMRWSVTNQPRRSEKNPKIMETWGFQVMATSLEVWTSGPILAVF